MTIEEIREVCEKIVREHGVSYAEYIEERREGEIKLANLTLKFKVGKKEGSHDVR